MGVPRVRFEEIAGLLRLSPACALRQDRKVEELQGLFDTLSFNKARVLLTYWDWAASQSGPYELAAEQRIQQEIVSAQDILLCQDLYLCIAHD